MKRVILDTNIYGEIIKQGDIEFTLENLNKSGLIVYGSQVIRKELRDVSKEKLTVSAGKKRKLRSLILSLYDSIVRKDLKATEDIMKIAKSYYSTFRLLGGITSQDNILTDFIIVAIAARNNLDIIYSIDDETMVSDLSRKSYQIANEIFGLRTPKFEKYGDLKNELYKKSM